MKKKKANAKRRKIWNKDLPVTWAKGGHKSLKLELIKELTK